MNLILTFRPSTCVHSLQLRPSAALSDSTALLSILIFLSRDVRFFYSVFF